MNSPLPLGIDVSNWQGTIDWQQVKDSGVQFAAVKATEGIDYTDPTFAYNWAELKRVGIYRISYHFARPDKNGADKEADYFLNTVINQGLEQGDILALDMEISIGNLGPWVTFFKRIVETWVPAKPLLYSTKSFIEEHNLNTPELAQCGLWLANWTNTMPEPVAPWPVIAIWQYSSKGTVPGIVGKVDMNRYNGPIETLPLYGVPAPVIPTPLLDIENRLLALLEQATDLTNGIQKLIDDVANQK